MAIGGGVFTSSWLRRVDYTSFVYPMTFGIVARAPAALGPENGFIQPFTMDVWNTLIVSSLLVSFTIGLFYFIYWFYGHGDDLVKIQQWPDIIILPFTMLFQPHIVKWFEKKSRFSGGGVLVGAWLFGVTLFVWTYHSNMEARKSVLLKARGHRVGEMLYSCGNFRWYYVALDFEVEIQTRFLDCTTMYLVQ